MRTIFVFLVDLYFWKSIYAAKSLRHYYFKGIYLLVDNNSKIFHIFGDNLVQCAKSGLVSIFMLQFIFFASFSQYYSNKFNKKISEKNIQLAQILKKKEKNPCSNFSQISTHYTPWISSQT